MEKAFDREVICFTLRRKIVPEYLVNGVMSLYKGCKTAVSVDSKLSSSSSMRVGVHQGTALSPLLFIMVADVLTEDARDGSLIVLPYADDLVLSGKSLNEVMDKYVIWKNAVEGKGPRVNVDKTKGMQLLFGKKSVLKVDFCGVGGQRIGFNSIQCTSCHSLVHRCCSDGPKQVSLLSCRDVFVCRTCLGHNCSVEKLEFKRGKNVLEKMEKFCYLGDMISCSGGASEAVMPTDVLRERVGGVVKIKDLIIQSRLQWYCCHARRNQFPNKLGYGSRNN